MGCEKSKYKKNDSKTAEYASLEFRGEIRLKIEVSELSFLGDILNLKTE